MSKTKPYDLEERRRVVLACLSSKKQLNGWNDKQMALKGRMSPKTLRRRLETPEDFTLKELWDLGVSIYLYDGQSHLPTDDGLIELRG